MHNATCGRSQSGVELHSVSTYRQPDGLEIHPTTCTHGSRECDRTRLIPPTAVVHPEAVETTLPPDYVGTEKIGITNTGGSDLVWHTGLLEAFVTQTVPGDWGEHPKGDDTDNGIGGISADSTGLARAVVCTT